MDDGSKLIDRFSTRVRQLVLQYNDLQDEIAALRADIEQRDSAIRQLEANVAQLKTDYECLKTARMLEITDGDMESAQKRLAKLIRDVDKCITLVSEK